MVTNIDSIPLTISRVESLTNDVILPFFRQSRPVNIVDRKRRNRRITIVNALAAQASQALRRSVYAYGRQEFESAADHAAIALENVSAAVTLIDSWD